MGLSPGATSIVMPPCILLLAAAIDLGPGHAVFGGSSRRSARTEAVSHPADR